MSLYFDNAATTQMDTEVFDAMLPYLKSLYFNPSSLYQGGRLVKAAIEKAENQIALLLNGNAEEIIFTSGGTEANNLAIKGVAFGLNEKKHIITSEIEHHSILDAFRWLETQGFSVTYLPVDSHGLVSPKDLQNAMRPDTGFVSIMWANNEVGALQPIQVLVDIVHDHDALFHCDAVQAICTQNIDVKTVGVDLLTISGHKIYGPKGVGALYCSRQVRLVPLAHGGQQNRRLRGGTEAVANMVGMGEAAELLLKERASEANRFKIMKEVFLEEMNGLDGIELNGLVEKSVPSIVNIGIRDVNVESLLIHLDIAGIQASLGAACNSKSLEPSHVLSAMQVNPDFLRSSIRFSFGKHNGHSEVVLLTKILKEKIKFLRKV